MVNPKVRKIAHSNSTSYHHDAAVIAVIIGKLILSNLGQVIKP
tara:strand:+ start:142 stop:270 length:129 start_codon:yes stop_codon:yes gene_type:complete